MGITIKHFKRVILQNIDPLSIIDAVKPPTIVT